MAIQPVPLNSDVLQNILMFCDTTDIATCRQVCRSWNATILISAQLRKAIALRIINQSGTHISDLPKELVQKFLQKNQCCLPMRIEVRTLISNSIQHTNTNNSLSYNNGAELVKSQAQAGDIKGAMVTVSLLKDEAVRDFALTHIVKILVDTAKTKDAIDTAKLIKDQYYKDRALNDISDEYARNQNFAQAAAVIDQIVDTDHKDKALGCVAKEYAILGKLTEVMETFDLMKSTDKKLCALHEIVKAQAKTNCYFRAILRHIKYIDLNTHTLWKIVQIQIEAGNLEDAVVTAMSMKSDSQIYVRRETLREIVEAQVNAGNLSRALAVTLLIKDGSDQKDKALTQIAEAQIKAENSVGTQNIAGLVKGSYHRKLLSPHGIKDAQLVMEATALLELIEDEEDRILLLYEIAKLQIKDKNLLGARETLRCLAAGAIADGVDGFYTLIKTIELQIDAEDINGARENLQVATDLVISDKKTFWQELELIVSLQARTGDIAKALQLVDLIEIDATKVEVLVNIARAQLKAEMIEARSTLQRAAAIAQNVDRTWFYPDIFCSVVKLQANAGYMTDAIATINSCKDDLKHKVFEHFINTYIKSGDLEEMDHSIRSAFFSIVSFKEREQVLYAIFNDKIKEKNLKSAQVIAGFIRDRTAVFPELINAQIEVGAFAEAKDLVRFVYGGSEDAAFCSIGKAQARVGKLEDAMETAERIDNAYHKNEVFCCIGKAQARVGKLEDAMETAERVERIDNAYHKSQVFRCISEAQVRAGKLEDAMETAERIDNAYHKNEVFCCIGEAQARAGKIEDAMETAERIDNTYHRDQVFSCIGEAQARAGKIEDAMETAERIKAKVDYYGTVESRERDQAFCRIAEALVETSQLEDAMKATEQINSLKIRNRVLCLLADAYVKAGDLKKIPAIVTSISFLKIISEDLDNRDKQNTLKTIAKAQIEAFDLENAKITIKYVHERYNFINKVLTPIVEAYITAQEMKKALAIVKLIDPETDKKTFRILLCRITLAKANVIMERRFVTWPSLPEPTLNLVESNPDIIEPNPNPEPRPKIIEPNPDIARRLWTWIQDRGNQLYSAVFDTLDVNPLNWTVFEDDEVR